MVSGLSFSASQAYSSATVSPWWVRSVGHLAGGGRAVGRFGGHAARLPVGRGASDALVGQLCIGRVPARPRSFEHVYDMPEWTIFGAAQGDARCRGSMAYGRTARDWPGAACCARSMRHLRPGLRPAARSVDTVAGRRASFVAVPGHRAVRRGDDRAWPTQRGLDGGAPRLRQQDRLGYAAARRRPDHRHRPARPACGITGRSELTAEVGTGTPVRALQAALALHGQRLAVDPPSPSATVGGMLAVNESGPLRHRFGAPADQRRPDQLRGRRPARPASPTARADRPGIADDRRRDHVGQRAAAAAAGRRRWVTLPVSTPLQVHDLVERDAGGTISSPSGDRGRPARPRPCGARPPTQPPGSVAVLLEGDPAEVRRARRPAGRVAGRARDGRPRSRRPGGGDTRSGRGTWRCASRCAIADLHAAVYALRRRGRRSRCRCAARRAWARCTRCCPGSFGPDRVERHPRRGAKRADGPQRPGADRVRATGDRALRRHGRPPRPLLSDAGWRGPVRRVSMCTGSRCSTSLGLVAPELGERPHRVGQVGELARSARPGSAPAAARSAGAAAVAHRGRA